MGAALHVAYDVVASPSTVDGNRWNMGSGNFLDISYQTLQVLGQNLLKFLTMNALSILKVAKLIIFQPKCFLCNLYCISLWERLSYEISWRGSFAVSEAVSSSKRRSDLKYFHEYVWVEINVTGGRNWLIGNY
jgi:hypothetical protein